MAIRTHPDKIESHEISRRRFMRGCAAGAAALASAAVLRRQAVGADVATRPARTGPASRIIPLVFKVVDRFGADRFLGSGEVRFQLDGPGELVGDNPFSLADSGGVGAVWIKTEAGVEGQIKVTATHSSLGKSSVILKVTHERPA